jgi:hypothetical protein
MKNMVWIVFGIADYAETCIILPNDRLSLKFGCVDLYSSQNGFRKKPKTKPVLVYCQC